MSPPAALVAALLAFASSVSGLPVPPGIAPQIMLADRAPDGRPLGLNDPEAAVTDWRDGSIVLYAGWGALGEGDNCILAHERQAYRVTLACMRAYHRPRYEIAWAERMIRRPHVAKAVRAVLALPR